MFPLHPSPGEKETSWTFVLTRGCDRGVVGDHDEQGGWNQTGANARVIVVGGVV
jgi:hypothetical protein